MRYFDLVLINYWVNWYKGSCVKIARVLRVPDFLQTTVIARSLPAGGRRGNPQQKIASPPTGGSQ